MNAKVEHEIEGVRFSWSESDGVEGCSHRAVVSIEEVTGELSICSKESRDGRVQWTWRLEIEGGPDRSADMHSSAMTSPSAFLLRATRTVAAHCNAVLQERRAKAREAQARIDRQVARTAAVQQALEELAQAG